MVQTNVATSTRDEVSRSKFGMKQLRRTCCTQS